MGRRLCQVGMVVNDESWLMFGDLTQVKGWVGEVAFMV